MGTLILARHHESEWNKRGVWTGSRDVDLTAYGFEMSENMGRLIRGIPIDQAFASTQVRSLETLFCMEDGVCINVPITRASAFNERDYGDYTGKNKLEVEQMIGKEAFDKLRRDWDYPVPHGETLKMTYERAVPYYLSTIVPLIQTGKTILLVAHGNSLRALIKYIENISNEGIANVEVPFGTVMIYDLDTEGRMNHKEIRQIESHVPA